MKVIYTYHARQRMKRRKISELEVEETIHNPEITTGGKKSSQKVLRKHVSGRFIKVVITREQDVLVITTAVVGEDR
ncbi:DUF4258 domain-containing protein [uncultured Corynebacterium sp.]|uniref:DUF4258 domain-containing protein n=1 Tax=uncultured Corynebacterium sp. TaxID=159447 RepID=UPI00344DAFBE